MRGAAHQEADVNDNKVRREWLTYPEAQELTHLGRTTLWAILSRGEIKAARVGRAVRISRASLEDFMERSAYCGREEKG